MKRKLGLGLATVVAAATTLLAACQKPPAPAAAGPEVRIGYSAWPGWFPWAVTEQQGLFAKEGVTARLQWFDGYLDSINALNAGQLDCNSQTLNDTISSIAGGADLTAVLVNDNSTGNDQIIAAPGIGSVADLKGRKVAAEEGTVDHYLLLLGLKKAGLTGKDIQFVPLETGAAAAAFAAGQVDAAGVFAPYTTQALKRQGSKALFTSREVPGAIPDLLVCRREFVEKHPEQIQAVVNSWFATLDWVQQNREAATPILVKRSGVSEQEFAEYAAGTTIFTLKQNLEAFSPGTSMVNMPYAADQMAAFLVEVGLAKQKPNLQALFSPQFVKALAEKRGIQ